MVKLRSAGYCNLKLLLIYLVIYGHLLEPSIHSSQAAMTQYKWIYFVHMPMFAFLSGLFLTDAKACRRQLCRSLPLYLFSQTMMMLLADSVQLNIPYWHLWYLLSGSWWAALAWAWFRLGKPGGLAVLTAAVVLGCLAGEAPEIGREHSLSRTIVFFPYFWAGLLCRPDFPFWKLRPLGIAALAAGTALALTRGSQISPYFLYHAAPFGPLENGAQLRLFCYGTGTLLCFGLLCVVPQRRFFFSRMGADTLPAYLLHPLLVLALREYRLHWALSAPIAAGFLAVLYKLLQWSSRPYGIIPGERKDRYWPRFRKSMKNMPGPYTGSSLP